MTDRLKEMLEARKAPGVAGVETGPGSCSNEFVWARPDPKKDIPMTLRKMEAAGQLKNPDTMRAAMIKYRASQQKEYAKIDYDKHGHPVDFPSPGEQNPASMVGGDD
jgi:hypothetical protein